MSKIITTHDELVDEWDNEDEIDLSRLDKSLSDCATMFNKYFKIHQRFKAIGINLEKQINQMKCQKRDYYLGKAPSEVYKNNPQNRTYTKSEIDDVINSDEEYANLVSAYEYNKQLIDGSHQILTHINYRPNMIRTILDFEKFRNGVL